MPNPLHAKRHTAALKIAATLHRTERLALRIQNAALTAALKDLHEAMTDAHAAHGAELGLGGIEQYSGGIPK